MVADTLSRNNLSIFFTQLGSSQPTAVISSPSLTTISGHHMDLQDLDGAVLRYFASEAIHIYSAKFVSCLGQQGLTHTSIRTYLSGVISCRLLMAEMIQGLTRFLGYIKS